MVQTFWKLTIHLTNYTHCKSRMKPRGSLNASQLISFKDEKNIYTVIDDK